MRFNPDASLYSHLVALVEDLAKLKPAPHLLVIVDDVDQVVKLADVEATLLGPIVKLSGTSAVSLLLAVRSDVRFGVLEELRQPSCNKVIRLSSFAREQAIRQLAILTMPERRDPSGALHFAEQFVSSLERYTWGIPRLNAELFEIASTRALGAPTVWPSAEIQKCLLRTWRMDPDVEQHRKFLENVMALHSRLPVEWTVDMVSTALGMTLMDAGTFRKKLQQLNVIERPHDAPLGWYHFTVDWASILTAIAPPSVP